MRYPARILSLLLVIATSCAPEKPKEKEQEGVILNADGTRTLRAFYRNKQLKSEVTYRDSARNGIARSYDEAGNLMLEMNYVDDKREGQSKRFYTGGVLFQTTEYKNDVMEGKQLKYRANGKPLSEARYENDHPCMGLKEYMDDGRERSKFPQIVIKEINRIAKSGDYTLEVSINGSLKKVKYYTGKLTRSGCISDSNNGVLTDEARRVGIIKYKLFPGEFVMDELNIVAVVETLNDNSYVCQKTFHVAIKN